MEHKVKKMKVVVKKIPKPSAEDLRKEPNWNPHWITDVEKLASLKCPYLMHIYDAFEDEDDAYIVMDYCEKGDLGDLMKERKNAGSFFSEAVSFLLNVMFSLFLLMCFRKCSSV
jgi:serine/threonine protein kinase